MYIAYTYYMNTWNIDPFVSDELLHGGNFIYALVNESILLIPGTANE